ncbi:hypothetical protein GQF61_01915 [Sphingobacterium sp. DK4209]|uniref:FabZ n=1 Tax=Sphingobacterium zhuxiongii TaxID=2662364 RepID=A0A5Q0Q9U0_9SPHI|nr:MULTISPECIES: hypothetical protein [unclassified Sphingobacterium]MVZ64592.1 hypothetical protein [Sphingobacterium sp. DK4209]QGA25919.1 hypothetical protein GFH32_06125 [Sphingobacterium sp. dk4302]
MISNIVLPINDMDIILACIPQRAPMLMVDGLKEYDEKRIIATLTIDVGNIFVKDQILQESGLIEHMAQSVALHTGFGYYLRQEQAPIGYIGSISNLDLLQSAKIGEQINTEALVLQEFSGVTLVEIVSRIGKTIIAKGQMKTVIAK